MLETTPNSQVTIRIFGAMSRKKLTLSVEEQTEWLCHLAGELASAEQCERRRLASLFDDLQHLLNGAEMQLDRVSG